MASSNIHSGIRVMLLMVVCLMAIVNVSVGQERICGHKLRDVIEMMCPNGVKGHPNNKRSFLSLEEEDLNNEDTDEENFDFGSSFDMRQFFESMQNNGIAKMRRRRHGIVHECCVNICTPAQIKKYCL